MISFPKLLWYDEKLITHQPNVRSSSVSFHPHQIPEKASDFVWTFQSRLALEAAHSSFDDEYEADCKILLYPVENLESLSARLDAMLANDATVNQIWRMTETTCVGMMSPWPEKMN